MAMEVEIIIRETIKPSCPTPQHLRTFNLSILDQGIPAIYVQPVLFYSNVDHVESIANMSQRLKASLSEILTHYYPLTGRIKDNAIVECNDDGAEYVEARVHGLLSKILEQPDADAIKKFLPIELESPKAASGPLLLVQANFFDCGGLALGISFSHKLVDASTMSAFIKAWSATALGCMNEAMHPSYIFGSLYPSKDLPTNLQPLEYRETNCITRRYVFDASKIAELKSKVATTTVLQPTRVEAVSALIWKCATTASRKNLGAIRPSLMLQAVNIRQRFIPPLPETAAGNLLGHFVARVEESYTDLRDLVIQLRKGLEDFSNNHARKLQEGDAFLAICEDGQKVQSHFKNFEQDFYTCSSWCRNSFYEADFGWGRPKWASMPSLRYPNSFTLLDTRDGGGIEALMTLREEDMSLVENDKELLEFASLNPSII